MNPEVSPGVKRVNTSEGVAYDFSGEKSGLLFGDPPPLKLDGSITVSVWIMPRQYAPNGAQSEIVFRGDDRNGYDPYCLALLADGTVTFAINNEKSEGMNVRAEINLHRWTHITASFSAQSGEMALWIDGREQAYGHTLKRPFANLEAQFTPGVGVGNVQNNHGPHNQPFDGLMADLRLYGGVYTPDQVGYIGNRNNVRP